MSENDICAAKSSSVGAQFAASSDQATMTEGRPAMLAIFSALSQGRAARVAIALLHESWLVGTAASSF